MKHLIPTPSDRAKYRARYGIAAPFGSLALAEVRRELRRPVRERNDAWLLDCALGCGIEVCEHPRRVDAVCLTRHSTFSAIDGVRIDWSRAEAMASDRTIRSAIKRLLSAHADAVRRCAYAPCPEWHEVQP
jgi:hypothetical protein